MNISETQQSGIRNTRQKSLVLECLKKNMEAHITADEIFEQLKLENTPVPKATIYRNLSLLEKSNVIKRFWVSDNAPACYQFVDEYANCHEHYHFMCQVCCQIVHFNDALLQKALSSLKMSNGFVINGNKTVFYGTCEKCIGTVQE